MKTFLIKFANFLLNRSIQWKEYCPRYSASTSLISSPPPAVGSPLCFTPFAFNLNIYLSLRCCQPFSTCSCLHFRNLQKIDSQITVWKNTVWKNTVWKIQFGKVQLGKIQFKCLKGHKSLGSLLQGVSRLVGRWIGFLVRPCRLITLIKCLLGSRDTGAVEICMNQ